MNRSQIRRLGVHALRLAQAPAVLRYVNRDRAAIATYHGFTRASTLDSINGHLHMHEDLFEQQLRFFSKRHAMVPLAEVEAMVAGRSAPVRNALALTSDDGYGSVYQVAFPLLQKYGAPMTVFLATDFVDGSEYLWHDRVAYCVDRLGQASAKPLELPVRDELLVLDTSSPASRVQGGRAVFDRIKVMDRAARDTVLNELEARSGFRLGDSGPVPAEFAHLTWSQVNEMIDSGLVSFGSHTKTHSIMTHCSESDVLHELVTSKARIEEETGQRCEAFCYPNGTRDDVSREVGRALESCGYRSAFTAGPGLVAKGSEPFELARFSANRSVESLELQVAGF